MIGLGLNTAADTSHPALFQAFANTKAVRTNGVDSLITFLDDSSSPLKVIDNRGTGTLALWFKAKSYASDLYIYNRVSGSDYFRILYTQSTDQLAIVGATNGNTVFSIFNVYSSASSFLTAQTWHHLAITMNKSTNWSATLYIDGNAKTPFATLVGPGSIAPGTTPDRMGVGILGTYSIISIDEIACWDGAVLSASAITELQSHYNLAQNSGNYTNSGELVRWYRLEDSTAEETGNGGAARLINSPVFITDTPFN